ncbi:MAG: LamG domain-containing protein [Spirochaetales bacterium]|nr:LamG domain-containing protein [Spirochaetales bacterium]
MYKKLGYSLVLIIALAMIGCVTATGVKGADSGKGDLKHSWTFDDGTAKDSVGGADGTLMGGAAVKEGALILSNLRQWMKMPAGAIALNTYKEVTIEAWFISSKNANASYHMLAFFGETVNNQGANYYFITPARGDDKSRAAISCGVTNNAWSAESGADGPEYDDGRLHHMVSTVNAKEITLYINGVMTAGTPLDSANSLAGISPDAAYLAKSGYEADDTWLGKILEFNIYNRALSADEIHSLFLKGQSSVVK